MSPLCAPKSNASKRGSGCQQVVSFIVSEHSMFVSRPKRFTTACAAVALAAIALFTSNATVTAQTAPTILYACYVPLTGTVYRIKEANLKPSCTSPSHIEFSWDPRGGPAGSTGPQGIIGPTGPQGAAG